MKKIFFLAIASWVVLSLFEPRPDSPSQMKTLAPRAEFTKEKIKYSLHRANPDPPNHPSDFMDGSNQLQVSAEEVLQAALRDDACFVVQNQYDESAVDQILANQWGQIKPRVLNPALESGPLTALSMNPEHRFIQALASLRLLMGWQSGTPDPHWGERLLQELATEFPQNGAYAYYYARALALREAPLNRQREALLKALDAPEFNTHIRELAEDWLSTHATNSSLWILMTNYLSRIPIPEMVSSAWMNQVLGDYLEEPEVINKLRSFGRRMNTNSKSTMLELVAGYRMALKFGESRSRLIDPNPIIHPPATANSDDAWGQLKSRACNPGPLAREFELVRQAGFVFR